MATFSVVVAVMPAFLVGASGVFLRADLNFDEAGLGVTIGVFFLASALSSVQGGRLAERIGAGQALMLVGVGGATVMLGIALLARNLTHLVLLLALGGCINGLAQPATNLALARGVVTRPAFMFGVKQSAIPLATLSAGLSVPLVSLTVGWRWAFAAGAALSVAVAFFVPRRLGPGSPGKVRRAREGDAATAPLIALAVASGVGTAAATSMGAFLVESAVAGGLDASTAGWLLASGSIAGVLARISAGFLADRYRGRALYAVSALLVVGGFGYGMLAMGGPVLLTLGTLLAFSCGWGWTGLLMFAVVRLNSNAPAAATGIVQSGAAGGASLGPFAFGYVVTTASFETAWALAAVAAFISAALVFAARTWLLRDRDRRQAAA